MSSTSITEGRTSTRPAMPAIIGPLLRRLAVWRTRARGRRVLRELDARTLSDIGVSQYDVAIEAAKPWWRA
jgi:uncharacterized protein YjiS (DUF1127 family)